MGEVIKGRIPYIEDAGNLSTSPDGPGGEVVIIGDNIAQVRKNKIVRGLGLPSSALEEQSEEERKKLRHGYVYELGRYIQEMCKLEESGIDEEAEEYITLRNSIKKLADYMDLQEIEWAEMVANHLDFDDPPPLPAA